jgi:hypothetical protein
MAQVAASMMACRTLRECRRQYGCRSQPSNPADWGQPAKAIEDDAADQGHRRAHPNDNWGARNWTEAQIQRAQRRLAGQDEDKRQSDHRSEDRGS